MATPATDAWPFPCPPDSPAFTSRGVADGSDWVQLVSRDADDGAWQFHPQGPRVSYDEMTVLHLRCVVTLDRTLATLADLPRGWRASRVSPAAAWARFRLDD